MTPIEVMREYALKWVGSWYGWAGDDPEAWDCSGLTQEILASVGEDPPGDQTAQALYDYFRLRQRHDRAELGSLAFYGKSYRDITHVGFCLNHLSLIEAGGGDSTTVNAKRAAEQNAFVRVRSIYRRKDLVVVIRPHYVFEG